MMNNWTTIEGNGTPPKVTDEHPDLAICRKQMHRNCVSLAIVTMLVIFLNGYVVSAVGSWFAVVNVVVTAFLMVMFVRFLRANTAAVHMNGRADGVAAVMRIIDGKWPPMPRIGESHEEFTKRVRKRNQ
jgi:uncharacterized membrane protein YwaF